MMVCDLMQCVLLIAACLVMPELLASKITCGSADENAAADRYTAGQFSQVTGCSEADAWRCQAC